MSEMARPVRYRAGVPVYHYRSAPRTPPVSVLRFDADSPPGHGTRHIHDFPVLVHVERAGEAAVYVVAPGAVIDPAALAGMAPGRGVFFDPAALDGTGRGAWSSHPLLFPFVHGVPGGLLALRVPADRRPMWTDTVTAIETELAGRGEGYRQAVLAHLTLLLVEVARLATDVVGDLRRNDEPRLAEVFDVIERRFGGPLSLRDVAESVGMTPGYLTTLVRRRTGRTVLDWITERRMVEARRLLAATDLPVGDVARRVGIADPAYFARVFRQSNGVAPLAWRRAS